MSGANCRNGCTSCPTCRGEVEQDAPVMKDMDFAMSMARGPMAQDRFLGPLSIAQVVRDGVRMRGGAEPTPEDARVLQFVDRVAEVASAGGLESVGIGVGGILFDAPPWKPTDPGPPPPGHPLRHPKEEDPPTTPAPTVGPGGEFPLPSTDGPTTTTSGARCCVEEFVFPIGLYLPKSGKKELGSKGRVRLEAFWDTRAKFIHDPPAGCDCNCCVYRQYVIFRNFKEWPIGSTEPKGESRWVTGREDCLWIIINTKTGAKRSEFALDPTTPPEVGPDEEAWLHCPGLRVPPEGERRIQNRSYRSCTYMYQSDTPAVVVSVEHWFEWEDAFMGIIFDKCMNMAIRSWKFFGYGVRGRVRADGLTTVYGWATPGAPRESEIPKREQEWLRDPNTVPGWAK